MKGRDIFDGFLVAIAFGALLFAYGKAGQSDFEAAQVTAKIAREVEEAREVSACDGATMKQFAAGQRWHPKGAEVEAECARGGKPPVYIMSLPCEFDGERCR